MTELKIIIIGSVELSEIAYSGLALSDDSFHIISYISDTQTDTEFFHDIKILPLEHLVSNLSNTSFDLIFIFSEFENKIRNILVKLGIDTSCIKNKDNIREYLSKTQIIQFLKEEIYMKHQAKYLYPNICVGDFTYGIPLVLMDDLETSLSIGKFGSIAHGVTIYLGGNHRCDWNTTYPFNMFVSDFKSISGHPSTNGNVTIGHDVWIGSDVKIMSGVTIGNGCIIGANALVTKDIPPYSIVGGVPAKLIRKRFDDSLIQLFEEMQWWDWNYEDIYNVIPYLQSNNYEALYHYYIDKI